MEVGDEFHPPSRFFHSLLRRYSDGLRTGLVGFDSRRKEERNRDKWKKEVQIKEKDEERGDGRKVKNGMKGRQ
jgi:hypothetical protein